MPDDTPDDRSTENTAALLVRLVGRDADAPAEILARSATSTSPDLLVAAAVLADGPTGALDRARNRATSSRDRQLVALAQAYLSGDDELLDMLVRDHLADHPESMLATWIATRPSHAGRS